MNKISLLIYDQKTCIIVICLFVIYFLILYAGKYFYSLTLSYKTINYLTKIVYLSFRMRNVEHLIKCV